MQTYGVDMKVTADLPIPPGRRFFSPVPAVQPGQFLASHVEFTHLGIHREDPPLQRPIAILTLVRFISSSSYSCASDVFWSTGCWY